MFFRKRHNVQEDGIFKLLIKKPTDNKFFILDFNNPNSITSSTRTLYEHLDLNFMKKLLLEEYNEAFIQDISNYPEHFQWKKQVYQFDHEKFDQFKSIAATEEKRIKLIFGYKVNQG